MRSLTQRVLGMRASLIPGFLDSALGSLGTFAVGLYATRYLEPDELGAYALFFGAFLLIIMVPAELIYRPTEVVTVGHPEQQRLGVLPNSLAIGFAPGVGVAAAFSLLALLVPSDVGFDQLLAFAATTAIAGVLSPVQDHVRRMFHQAGRSPLAAAVSAMQLIAVLLALLGLELAGVGREWIPMGALATANAVSLAFGLAIVARVHPGGRIDLVASELYRTGGWLVTSGFAIVGGQVSSIVLITILAGASYAGFAQAAIILAQPLFVVANGLGSVLNPRIMEAAGVGNERDARGHSRAYSWLMVAASAGLLLAIGIEWSFSPMPDLFPNAYSTNGLLALTIAAQGLNYALFGNQFELIGGRSHVPMAKATFTASLAQGVVGGAAGFLKEFTAAWGIATAVIAKAAFFRQALRRMYGEQEEPA